MKENEKPDEKEDENPFRTYLRSSDEKKKDDLLRVTIPEEPPSKEESQIGIKRERDKDDFEENMFARMAKKFKRFNELSENDVVKEALAINMDDYLIPLKVEDIELIAAPHQDRKYAKLMKRKRLNLVKPLKWNKEKKIDDRQKHLNYLMKQVSKGTQLDAAIKGAKFSLSQDEEEFFKELIDLKVDKEKISLPKKICQNSVYTYFVGDYLIDKMSNDTLWLSMLALSAMYSEDEFLVNKQLIIPERAKFVSVQDVYLDNVESFYCEDFFSEIYGNEYCLLDEASRKEVLDYIYSMEPHSYFFMNDRKYDVYRFEWGRIIIADDLNKDIVKDRLLKALVFHNDKILKDGIKEFNMKDKGKIFYLSFDLKFTSFCPSTCIFRPAVPTKCMFKFKIDFTRLVSVCIQEKKFIMMENMVYWDYLHSSMEFFMFIYFISNKSFIAGAKKLKVIYDLYVAYKEYLFMWKRHFENFKKIVYTFLGCFTFKININALQDIVSACTVYNLNDGNLRDDPGFGFVIRMLHTISEGCIMMINFTSNKSMEVIMGIKNICEELNTGKMTDVSLRLRSVAINVYNVFLTGTTPMINDIRCEALFLGSLIKTHAIEDLLSNLKKSLNDFKLKNFYTTEQMLADKNRQYDEAEQIALDRLKITLDQKMFGDLGLFLYEDITKNPSDYSEIIKKITGFTRRRLKNKNVDKEMLRQLPFDSPAFVLELLEMIQEVKEIMDDKVQPDLNFIDDLKIEREKKNVLKNRLKQSVQPTQGDFARNRRRIKLHKGKGLKIPTEIVSEVKKKYKESKDEGQIKKEEIINTDIKKDVRGINIKKEDIKVEQKKPEEPNLLFDEENWPMKQHRGIDADTNHFKFHIPSSENPYKIDVQTVFLDISKEKTEGNVSALLEKFLIERVEPADIKLYHIQELTQDVTTEILDKIRPGLRHFRYKGYILDSTGNVYNIEKIQLLDRVNLGEQKPPDESVIMGGQ